MCRPNVLRSVEICMATYRKTGGPPLSHSLCSFHNISLFPAVSVTVAHACVRRGGSCNTSDTEVKFDRMQLYLTSWRVGGQRDLVLLFALDRYNQLLSQISCFCQPNRRGRQKYWNKTFSPRVSRFSRLSRTRNEVMSHIITVPL